MAWGRRPGSQLADDAARLLLASIGLGATNTPVTNTTTGSVPTARRHGVRHRHQRALHQPGAEHRDGLHPGGRHRLSFLQAAPPAIDAAQLRSLAEQLTTGTAPTIGRGAAAWTVPAETARQALAHGFGWVMLYGGVSVWLFALGSLLVFGAPRARRDRAGSSVQ